jgi:DNA processing protein
MSQLSALVTLSLLPIRLYRFISEQLRAGDTPETVLDRVLVEQWPDEPGKRSQLRSRAAAALARADRAGIASIAWNDRAYPSMLAAIPDPPPLLWMRGVAAALNRPAVAMVGSRAGSAYALEMARQLAADLAARGVVVVSGLARGVDAASHRGALSAGGSTLSVLGSGVDIVYPPEHASLAREIEATGATLSELTPGTPAQPAFFPRRNRIISGLSRAVVVIEAGAKSGALITARAALDQGRAVLAVPGHVLGGRNRGAHALLRDGAKIVETADDILEELGPPSWSPLSAGFTAGACQAPERGREPAGSGTSSQSMMDPVLASLPPGECCDLDRIAERTGLTPARLLQRLCELEILGLVRRVGGGRFLRFDRTC